MFYVAMVKASTFPKGCAEFTLSTAIIERDFTFHANKKQKKNQKPIELSYQDLCNEMKIRFN